MTFQRQELHHDQRTKTHSRPWYRLKRRHSRWLASAVSSRNRRRTTFSRPSLTNENPFHDPSTNCVKPSKNSKYRNFFAEFDRLEAATCEKTTIELAAR
ncbi:hypothetical protein K443DRAFT_225686 [Laccaria amethystina LaAM-08-1]|uniref:Uncharacterized protein n=1 Tax=Laccaria amethystina LaAM-08-1 TaxID=1095629 RepID=A0A0C9WYJ7_9AGAR|nr:hypothetical protein K443DRAFT_225686 [Laccaria amethystina LaAM-08-1]